MFNPVQLVTFQPENILCLTKSGNRIKIIDFGLARRFEPMKKLQILFGTPEFVAPEVFFFSIMDFLSFLYVLTSYNCLQRWWTLSPSATAPICGRWGWSHMSCEYLQEKHPIEVFFIKYFLWVFFYRTHAFCEHFQTPHQVIFLRPNPFNWI